MKLTFCIAIFIGVSIFGQTIFAQDALQDSLRMEDLLGNKDVESLQEALSLARENYWQNGKERALKELSYYFLRIGKNSYALSYKLQLLAELEKQKDNNKIYPLLLSIGDIYQFEKLPKKALQYFHRANAMIENDVDQTNRLHNKLSTAYFSNNNIDSALFHQDQLLSYFEQIKDEGGQVDARREIISILMESEKYEAALKQNLVILELVQQKENPDLLAAVNNNIGYNYNYLQQYDEALNFFIEAEKLNKRKDVLNSAVLFTNIGIVYSNLGQFQNSINYLLQAENKLIKQKDTEALCRLYHLMATIYLTNGDTYNALNYNVRAGKLAEEKNFSDIKSESYFTSALIYQDIYEYEKALEFYQLHLDIRDSILLEERLRQQELTQQQNLLERSEKEIKLLLVNQEVQDLMIGQLELEKQKLKLSSDKLKLEAARKADELELLKKEQKIQEGEVQNQELAAQKAKQELLIAEQKLLAQNRDQEIQELAQKEKLAQVELEKKAVVEKERLVEIELLEKGNELLQMKTEMNDLEIKQQTEFKSWAYKIGALLGFLMLTILGGLINSSRKNRQLAKQKNEIEGQKSEIEENRDLIELERSKAESLLLNILPKETARELKEAGVAQPKKYKEVSILFTDFSNFTQLVQDLNPDELIHDLNQFFLAFDEICERRNIEKIKTIGDSFMCAGGIPVANTSHARDTVLAAIDMQKVVQSLNAERIKKNLPPWEMRVGIHTGSVIAGVVGSKKFAYDIWGDAVNTASRLESACETGRVNISDTTYALIKNDFECTFRGAIEAKHKGDIDMYFVSF